MSAIETGAETPIASLHGMGGVMLLHHDRIRVLRHGPWFTAVNLLSHLEREIETTVLLRDVVAVHLVRSLLLVQFLRLTYPGCPAPSGHYLRDAFAENAFMYSLADNRPLLAMKQRIVEMARRV